MKVTTGGTTIASKWGTVTSWETGGVETTTEEATETEVVAVEGDELEMVEGAGRVAGIVPNSSAGVCRGTV